MLIELKNGETYNGHLIGCDNYMNVHLREVICTSRDGDRFWKMPECYVRGSSIKYLRIPDEVVNKVREDQQASRQRQHQFQPKRPAVGGGAGPQGQRGGSAGGFGGRGQQRGGSQQGRGGGPGRGGGGRGGSAGPGRGRGGGNAR